MDLHDSLVDGVGWVANHAQRGLDNIGDFSLQHPGIVFVTAALSGAAVTYGYIQTWMKNRKPVDEASEMKRRAQLDQMYADAFGDKLFDMLMAGTITRHEYRRDCKRFGIAYRLSDLLVRKNPKRGMAYRVRKNCEEMHRSPPPKLPDETVLVVASVNTPKVRRVWVASKAALRLKSAG